MYSLKVQYESDVKLNKWNKPVYYRGNTQGEKKYDINNIICNTACDVTCIRKITLIFKRLVLFICITPAVLIKRLHPYD